MTTTGVLACEAKLGDYVIDSLDRKGRVTAVHLGCPQDALWLALQLYLTPEQKAEYIWVSILLHGGGSVIQPGSTVKVIEAFPFQNNWADVYFRDGE